MFGRKKEEEWEYIGDNYRLNDDGEIVASQYNAPENMKQIIIKFKIKRK